MIKNTHKKGFIKSKHLQGPGVKPHITWYSNMQFQHQRWPLFLPCLEPNTRYEACVKERWPSLYSGDSALDDRTLQIYSYEGESTGSLA